MILDAFQDNEVGKVMDPTKFSRNYKIGSLEGNMIFEGENKLPKEVILEMTLNAFGYDIDMFEVCFLFLFCYIFIFKRLVFPCPGIVFHSPNILQLMN